MIDRHHLLECILWPNGDGTFRKIVNKAKKLKELGVYKDFKLTIPIDHSIHQTMHWEFERNTEYERAGDKHAMHGRTGDKNPMYGRTGDKNPMYGKGYLIEGDKNAMYGRTGDKSPKWKCDKAVGITKYMRAKKLYKSGKMTEEEFQPFRDIWNEYKKERRKNQRSLNSLPID